MMTTFGWKTAVAVIVNAVGVVLIFRKELSGLSLMALGDESDRVSPALIVVHFAFLIGIVVFAHQPAIFMDLFLFFLGVATAYKKP